MKKLSLFVFLIIYPSFSIFYCLGIESPQFNVVHSEPEFEIRLYRELSWMSASVRTDSFENATKEGFHRQSTQWDSNILKMVKNPCWSKLPQDDIELFRLYQYIHGANENSSQLAMTSPVLTSVEAAGAESSYVVRLYLSPEIKGAVPVPLPDLNLQLDKWDSHCIVVRKFSGFAQEDNTVKEAENLLASLRTSNSTNQLILEDKHLYAIAQYNSTSHLVGRLNEVWMNVLGYAGGGC